MGENLNYDVSLLMKSGDFDVRGVAANNLSLTAKEYFRLLTKLIEDMPVAMEVLERASGFYNSKEDILILEFMKSLLDQVGCKSFAADMAGIIEVISRGNRGLSATRANGMMKEFPELCKRIRAAEKKPLSSPLSAIGSLEVLRDGDDHQPDDKMTLKTLLEQIEYEQSIGKPRILAVDDAAVVLRTVYGVLSADYTVYMLSQPAMLEKVLEHVVPDLFLLDYEMPELSGFDLVPIIRNIPEHKETPIIFLTAMGTIDHISTAVLLGACDFMVKPFQPDRLREKVAKHIVRKNMLP